MEGTATGSEIAARFERATRSGLASSSLASYSYSQASSMIEQPPTLADLLPHLGPPDAPRCPVCRACLPFGPRSRICLACSARLVQTSPPSFPSSLAFRRFAEALHLEGLETDSGEADAEFRSDPEADMATKLSSSSLSPPVKVVGQIALRHADMPSDREKPNIEPEEVKAETKKASSADLGFIIPAKPTDAASVEEETHTGMLDYSAKLEGISLEDFFSNQGKSPAPASATDSDILSDKRPISMESPGIKIHKDSLFWDPLSDSIIPDGFDLLANTRETNTIQVALDNVVGVRDGDDLLSSWENDFQSATPAAAEVSAASSFHSPGAQLSADAITSRNIEDVFSGFPSISRGETVGSPGHDSWVNGGDLLGLKTENTCNADSQKSTIVDDFFGSGWQQNVSHPVVSSPSESHSSIKSIQVEDLLQISLSKEMEPPTIDHSPDLAGELTSLGNLPTGQLASASDSGGEKSKIVSSLLAQLHDLSFLLTDKLVMKAAGESTKPDFSS